MNALSVGNTGNSHRTTITIHSFPLHSMTVKIGHLQPHFMILCRVHVPSMRNYVGLRVIVQTVKRGLCVSHNPDTGKVRLLAKAKEKRASDETTIRTKL